MQSRFAHKIHSYNYAHAHTHTHTHTYTHTNTHVITQKTITLRSLIATVRNFQEELNHYIFKVDKIICFPKLLFLITLKNFDSGKLQIVILKESIHNKRYFDYPNP